MDRTYAEPLDVPALARIACASEAHFIRTFRATFGETPHRYLQRRRVERAMWLLRESTRSVTEICGDVGFASLGTFSRTFRDIVGVSPVAYRQSREPAGRAVAPTCSTMAWTRRSSFGEADACAGPSGPRIPPALPPPRTKATVVGFWLAPPLSALQMAFPAYAQLRLPQASDAFAPLGFPPYFRIE